jgi:arginyl-tRNA synthetase
MSLSLSATTKALESLSVSEAAQFPGSDPERNPLDSFRNAIASQMALLTGVDPKLIWDMIEEPKTKEHGDFAVPIPRLRLKGNPVQLCKEFAEKVHTATNTTQIHSFLTSVFSSLQTSSFCQLLLQVLS